MVKSALLAAAALQLVIPVCALATEFPHQQPITLIVGFGPGGSTDIIARFLAPKLKAALGQTIVVDNRPGASGIIATEAMLRAPADGYTLFACTNGVLTTHKYLFKQLKFDAAKDILPVTQIASVPYVLLAHPSVPANTPAEFVALAKKEPGKIMYGSAGVGSAGHLAAEMFSSKVGINMNHVPYKGSGQAMSDLVAGTINVAFDQQSTVAGFLAGDRLKAIAVASKERLPSLPKVPTFNEAGIAFEAASWTGICIRSGTPAPIVDKISRAVREVMAQQDVRKRFEELGIQPKSTTPQEFQTLVANDRDRMGKAITAIGIRPE
ncbi:MULTISPECIES: tripartite tricarboxylate transporter substrate binding protein [unclassified Cupriavidus]|uniref:Bug family tripartite tricarboxylate transporter substrate binding protein n=1 Tax=unclassified Cupriavidus TaxID=2640874 RepID=UPI00105641B2|nr:MULTISPECIES: tripartite tricarboxylate transporter substrate binding protein [unclassified Cupriavidus]MBF6989137.1 tripartite tricarboxylate transporter substrate binding protein [Cupriavidus sp. IK-TO18]TDF61922.1 tripartite tricarboxylate transporter substrate binding protein [Cupriavidus sp. L7L]